MPGLFTLVLHTHLPWLAHHGRWPVGEAWLYQSWSASYLPLLRVLRKLAGEDRRRLLEAERPDGPLYELRIVVANRPGTMATLALALGEAGVNIEDMVLDPAPDLTSGAVSLWVAGADQAERGAELVRELGHGVTVVGAGG